MMKKKRFLAALLTAAVLYSGIYVPARAASFQDVVENSWYAAYVYDLVQQGVISGTSPTSFSPEKKLTRGAFVTMLANTVLSKEELQEYNFQGRFKDVTPKHWSNRFVNWAAENGIVSGFENKTFLPDKAVSRQDMAVMTVNFANAMGRKMQELNSPAAFADSGSIAKYAASSVRLCQQAGVINGYKEDNTFRPNGVATRAEAAALYSNFLKNCKPGSVSIIRKRVNGTAIKAVEFDPSSYTANLALGRDLVDGAEAPSSLVKRTGAVIAVNAAFFNMSSYMPVATLIKEGRVVTVSDKFAPHKSAFSMDSSGKFSIENFAVSHTVTLHQGEAEDIVLEKVMFNTWPSNEKDATRILFTRDWGHTLCFPAKDAVTLDENGVILSISHDKDVEIPEKGYVLAQRSRRQYEGKFFDSCQVGDTLDIQRLYDGASTQDLTLSIGAGPRIVKDGAVYGNLSSYQAEGYYDANITTYSALRMCIGIKPDGRLLILSANTTLAQLSQIMVAMGCRDAINFDGGGSANLYADGFWVVGPQSRALNNMLYFK